MNIGIIGTAGRGDDAGRLDKDVYERMITATRNLVEDISGENKVTLISGGAAYADHIAVKLYLSDPQKYNLRLYLPEEFDLENKRYRDTGVVDWKTNPGGTANFYHDKYSRKTGDSSLREIATAIEGGAEVVVRRGLFERNKLVADDVEVMIALTYGMGPVVKDGGTKNTMDLFIKKRQEGYHIDINDVKTYSIKRRMLNSPFKNEQNEWLF